jgi:hypothetical protein
MHLRKLQFLKNTSRSNLVEMIDKKRNHPNLSSALRLFFSITIAALFDAQTQARRPVPDDARQHARALLTHTAQLRGLVFLDGLCKRSTERFLAQVAKQIWG